ncbi:helix-turn-helix domain-containing protein [Natronosporangium hydrolyticum]|uniref:Helix-turn-helix domain-containing protein n=1 Tax=Natronosporangium hydrolyticum TaxID=2811111 RepID=A0A895Y9R7_9ACTN|nr:helix-turn-helix domain-containing protein [Natronosporangium hydrolyticum]QSB14487.1 helix-turn-helix domain-containing protein [Natronosporangium hydrolyticum]
MAVSTPFRRVVAYAPERVASFSLGIISEVFGYDRTDRGMPGFEFTLCARQPGPMRTDTGVTIVVEHGLDRLADADLVIVLPWEEHEVAPGDALTAALHAAVDRGAIVAGTCTGSVTLAAAGLLTGRRATTHWRWAGEFARRFPAVTVEPDMLYVDEGRIVTAAGAASAVDMSLYLLRREHGAAVANAFARDMVVPPHREGGQAQFVAAPVPDGCEDDRLADVLAWARAHLDQPLTVPQLAARALMSPRSFARRFRAATGTTPRAWLLGQRLLRAEELLEAGTLAIEEVARRTGFGTSAALREQFLRRRGVPPRDYRRTFAAR